MTRGGYARQTGTGTENTSSVGTTQGLKLKLRGYGRQKRDKAGYGSHSQHQDGHARGGPIAEARECNGMAMLIYENVAVLLYQQGHVVEVKVDATVDFPLLGYFSRQVYNPVLFFYIVIISCSHRDY